LVGGSNPPELTIWEIADLQGGAFAAGGGVASTLKAKV